VDRLKDNIAEFNKKEILPFPLSISVGFDTISDSLSSDAFLTRIDFLMYQDKRNQIYEE
jgi:hypothetical protein